MRQSLALPLPQNGGPRRLLPQAPRLQVLWLLLSACLLAFIAEYGFASGLPELAFILSIASCVNCGLSWLLARELFSGRATTKSSWPDGVVIFLFAASLLLYFSDLSGLHRVGVVGFISQIATLVSSTVLVLPFFEAFDGFDRSDPKERRFRLIYVAGYASLLGTSLILAAPSLAGIEHLGQVICCVFGLIGAAAAVQYRKQSLCVGPQTRANGEETVYLAERITSLLVKDRVFLNPEIKVHDLARSLGQPDYKVTRCITQQLGFQNFNQLINFYRIEEAKSLLSGRNHDDQSILSIAMQSGFGSIGPFNRAFKSRTNLTPRAYRLDQRRS